ncbi:hypothetical protein DPMN_152075 [Dreissena polymorpha]|uniref:Uncharacterized protein n=1 Tax=Dreissena polymorpha TaxID=45954 RepID=A0A9D4FKN6_DREPO|nr:hypothetical protein DPMN_152075 [Dreissena polymorpha]
MSALKQQGNLLSGTPMERGRAGCIETPEAETLETPRSGCQADWPNVETVGATRPERYE